MSHKLMIANASAIHPVRRILPPPVEYQAPRDRSNDFRLFATTFVAGFVVFYGMIL